MTRFQLLQNAYSQYDTIYSGLLLAAAWVAGSAHLLDALTVRRGRILVPIFWTLVIVSYLGGILALGLLLI